MPDASCRTCGGALPAGAAFCPQCGTRVADDPTAAAGADTHVYGVTPSMVVLALGAAGLAAGVLLLALDYVVAGFLVLAAAGLLGLVFAATVTRRPSGGTAGGARERARAATATLAERAAARRELGRLLREREQLRGARPRLLLSLGQAAYADDEEATRSVRAELDGLDRALADKEAELQALAGSTGEQVAAAAPEEQPTAIVEPAAAAAEPPPALWDPADAPEPMPVPSPEPLPAPVAEPPSEPEPGPR